MPKGFTLIEILVAISIIGLLGITAIPNLKSFNETQVLTNSAQDLVYALKTAQSNAQLGTLCPSGKASNSWYVNLNNGTSGFELWANCNNRDGTAINELKTATNFPSTSITISSSSCNGAYPIKISFVANSLSLTCGGLNQTLPFNITLINSNIKSNNRRIITLDKGGALNVQSQ